MNQFYPFTLKACAARALKMAGLFTLSIVLVQASMAQSADKPSAQSTKTNDFHPRSFLNVHPNADKACISVGHPAAAGEAQLKLVDANGKTLQQVAVSKNSRQTKLTITGLPNGDYKIVWSDGTKTIEQPLLMM